MNILERIKEFMTPKTGVTMIEVEDALGEGFNAQKELFKLLKERIADKQARIVDLEMESSRLRTENASLRAQLSNIPPVQVEVAKHFITTSGLRAELERRSKEEKALNAKKTAG